MGRKHCQAKAERKDVAGMTHVFIKCRDDTEKVKVLCWLLCDPVLVGSAIVFCKNKSSSGVGGPGPGGCDLCDLLVVQPPRCRLASGRKTCDVA